MLVLFPFARLRAGEDFFIDEIEAALADPILPGSPSTFPIRQHTPVAKAVAAASDSSLAQAAAASPSPGMWSTANPGASPRSVGGLFPDVRVRVTARRHTILSANSTGRIEELPVEDGNRFSEGDTLARLDGTMAEMQIARAEALLARQEVLYRLARELADLQSKGEAEVEVSRMEMEQARADLQAAEFLLARTRVTAPFSGRVGEVFAREKQYVNEGTPLLEILDDSTLELEFIVPSRWIRWFKPGFRFKVMVEETGAVHEAVLERLGGKVDPLSQSMKAYASLLDLTPDLMEGMSGSAHITPPAGEQ